MSINRREFMILSAAVAAGCAANQPVHLQPTSFDAGPASDYNGDGVYTQFRDQGFFIIRRNGKLTALSSICTHRGCKVTELPDTSYHCKCHGSNYDPSGKVTHGPAIHDLPELPTSIDANGRLIIGATAA
jgi:Rieske Fe-S protein